MLVVIGCTSLTQILSEPGFLLARFNIRLGLNLRQRTKLLESQARTRPATTKHRIIGAWIDRQDALDVSVNDSVHRPVESLARLHSAVEDPTPLRLLFRLSIGRISTPRGVSPQDWLMERSGLPDRSGVHPVVEEMRQERFASSDRLGTADAIPWVASSDASRNRAS